MVTHPFSFFRLDKIIAILRIPKFRAMIAGIGVMMYYLIVYSLVPEYLSPDSFALDVLFNDANRAAMLIAPIAGAALAFAAPILMAKLGIKAGTSQQAAPASVPAAQPYVSASEPAPSAPQPVVEQAPPPPAPEPVPAVNVGALVEEAVGTKMTEVTAEVGAFKKDVGSMKGDIETLKQNIQNLTASLESSLTDMKTFQAEMVNPLNFMRKYFETMDIKSLSDPTQGLPPLMPVADRMPPREERVEALPEARPEPTPIPIQHEKPEPSAPVIESSAIAHAISMNPISNESNENEQAAADIAQLFRGKLTLGKMMSMAPVLEKILRDMGPGGVDTLVEQYRLLGMRSEDEQAIYNMVLMLKDFGLSSEEIMVKLYRLGQVMGVKDRQADLEYTKLQARTKPVSRGSSRKPEKVAATKGAKRRG